MGRESRFEMTQAVELLSPDEFALSQPCPVCSAAVGRRCRTSAGWQGNDPSLTQSLPHFGRAGDPTVRGFKLVAVGPGKVATLRIPARVSGLEKVG
jgi:hypothetical protein